jgi:hypothetical protein
VLLAVALVAGAQQAFKPPVEPGLYEALSERLGQAEAELARRVLEPQPSLIPAELERYRLLDQEIRASFYGDLVDRSRFVLLLTEALREPPAAAPQIVEPPPNLTKPAGVLLGTAVISFGLSYGCWALAERQDVLYLGSATPEEATVHRKRFAAYRLTGLILAALGTLSSGTSASLLAADRR